jgi:hypothetical protein
MPSAASKAAARDQPRKRKAVATAGAPAKQSKFADLKKYMTPTASQASTTPGTSAPSNLTPASSPTSMFAGSVAPETPPSGQPNPATPRFDDDNFGLSFGIVGGPADEHGMEPSTRGAAMPVEAGNGLNEQLASAERELLASFNAKPKDEEDGNDTTCTDPDIEKWRALADNGVELRSAEGQRFQRDANGGKSSNYKGLTTAEKALFRKAWAAAIYEKTKQLKSKEKAWRRVDKSKGVYMPFTVIVQNEGADEAAVVAAKHYAEACQKMGGVWTKYNVMTKRWEFLYMKQEVSEIFEESWRMYEESIKEKGQLTARAVDGESGSPDTGTGTPAKKGGRTRGALPQQGSPAVAAGGGPGGSAGGEQGGKPVKQEKKVASDFDTAVSSAAGVKKVYMATMSKANLLMYNITTSAEWQTWASGHWKSQLVVAIEPVQQKAASGFAREYLMQDFKLIKQKMPQKELLSNLLQVVKDFDKPLQKLGNLISKMMSMHAEAMK